MPSLTALLSKWPVIRQIRERADGTGLEAMSDKTRAMHARIDDAKAVRSICPYCGVGCGQLVHHKDGATINHTTAICHLGGATLDNEENYLIKKLFTGGLGMVCISNQARI